jgi:hypothetical protein
MVNKYACPPRARKRVVFDPLAHLDFRVVLLNTPLWRPCGRYFKADLVLDRLYQCIFWDWHACQSALELLVDKSFRSRNFILCEDAEDARTVQKRFDVRILTATSLMECLTA